MSIHCLNAAKGAGGSVNPIRYAASLTETVPCARYRYSNGGGRRATLYLFEVRGACRRGVSLKSPFRVQPARGRCWLGTFGTQHAAVRDGEDGAEAG